MSASVLIAFSTIHSQQKSLPPLTLSEAFDIVMYVVYKEGDLFYSGEKHLYIEGKTIKLSNNTLYIYPDSISDVELIKGLSKDVVPFVYSVSRNARDQVVFSMEGNNVFNRELESYEISSADFIRLADQIRYYTFNYFQLEVKKPVVLNGLTLNLLYVADEAIEVSENSSLQIDNSIFHMIQMDVEAKSGNFIDTLSFHMGTDIPEIYNHSFDSYWIYWKNPSFEITSGNKKPLLRVIKKHPLPVWNYIIESILDPSYSEAKERFYKIHEVSTRWRLPINLLYIVSSLSHDYDIESEHFEVLKKQNEAISTVYQEIHGENWLERFTNEVDKEMKME